jgi:hypothetical protein
VVVTTPRWLPTNPSRKGGTVSFVDYTRIVTDANEGRKIKEQKLTVGKLGNLEIDLFEHGISEWSIGRRSMNLNASRRHNTWMLFY